ncbi:MAG: hypothetical protein ABH986_06995 [archaeon]
MSNIKITFDKSAKKEIFDLLGKDVDKDGYIVEKENPSQRVLAFDEQEIKADEFGGYKKGSEIFIRDNVVSLFKFIKSKK